MLATQHVRSHLIICRENQSVETVQASKLLAAGGKELKALRALVNNEHLAKYPGPQAIDKFFEKKA